MGEDCGNPLPRGTFTGRTAVATLLLCFSVLAPIQGVRGADSPGVLDEQRENYQRALKALERGNDTAFRALREDLLDYPLLPYLDYADLSIRIRHADEEEVAGFLSTYTDTPLNAWLRDRWLERLAAGKRWKTFIRYYDSDLKSVDLACYNAYGEYVVGNRETGIALGKALWLEGRSRPASCDLVFEKLIGDGHVDDQWAWDRYILALLNHEYRLAEYITRFFTLESTRQRAALFLAVDRNPRRIADYELFREDSADERDIIRHGLTHLARIDAQMALNLWNRYHQSHKFGPAEESDIIGTLVRSLYIQGHEDAADRYFFLEQDKVGDDIMEWRLRELVQAAEWRTLIEWGGKLAGRFRDNSRWKYWHARALELAGNAAPERSRRLYREISGERSFYGFLASEWLNTPFSMEHEPVGVSGAEVAALAATPVFRRIRELYHHGELLWARREWYRHLDGGEASRWIVAAKLAEDWGWHSQAIISIIQAQYWNDIVVRFPVPYKDEFLSQSEATEIPVHLLLALSRQESAFNEKAVSPAGARGLMQLMPGTARETARRYNIRYGGVEDLEEAEKNILIGSRYYRQMLERFNNNRILATAAYNAGPHRVDTWRRRSGGKLPFDAWIEAIPFRETRNYVQNVLAFSIIYAHHLGLEVGILSPEEKDTLL